MNDIYKIAIDGPGGAGKSTVAKEVAKKLNIEYIDTGAMYRAVAYKLISNNIDINNISDVEKVINETDIDFSKGRTFLDGEDVSTAIRGGDISKMASSCSALEVVRNKLVKLQRDMAQRKSVVMDGRDIGTNVLKDADFKFFLTAKADVRGRRRYYELLEKGQDTNYEQVLKEINERDYNDTHRKLNPLRKAEDAVEIDSSNMSAEKVVDFICEELKRRGNC